MEVSTRWEDAIPPREGQSTSVNDVAWSPDGAELAAASLTGTVHIFNVASGRLIAAPEAHIGGASYKLHWYAGDGGARGLLASAGGDASAVVLDRTGLELMRYSLPAATFGIEWSPAAPTDENVAFLAVGCANGSAYVYKFGITTQTVDAPLLVLSGHAERVFHVAWSPLVANLIATGSDDATVKVWSLGDRLEEAAGAPPRALPLSVGPRRTLKGHSKRIRPLCWSFEIPSLLLSGSWDATIIAWDVSAEDQQLSVSHTHVADVYGISSHPKRPFVYASCSRDNTLRVSVLRGPVEQARLRSSLSMRFPAYLLAPHPPSAAELLSGQGEAKGARSAPYPLRLCGRESAELAAFMCGDGAFVSGRLVSVSWERLLSFFDAGTGHGDLWFVASDSLQGREVPPPMVLRVVPTKQASLRYNTCSVQKRGR